MKIPSKKIICIDFDGTLSTYASGWCGTMNIPDLPIEGALDFINEAVKHFDVQIYSTRNGLVGGILGMKTWLSKWEFPVNQLKFPLDKPPLHMIIDDRSYCFTGSYPTMEEIEKFKPWNKE